MVAQSVSNVVPSSEIDTAISIDRMDYFYRLTLARSFPATCETERAIDDGLVGLIVAGDDEQFREFGQQFRDDVGPLCPRPS
jgi:hypothetical protein